MKPRLNKFQIAHLRAAAIDGIRRSCPSATAAEIGAALGMKPGSVRYHLDGHIKWKQDVRPAWFVPLMRACSHLCSDQRKEAGEAFARLAEELSK